MNVALIDLGVQADAHRWTQQKATAIEFLAAWDEQSGGARPHQHPQSAVVKWTASQCY